MNYLAPFTSIPGDFSSENTIDNHSQFMLNDAFKAVDSIPDGWTILARPDVPGTRACLYCGTDTSRRCGCAICGGTGIVDCCFMFDSHPEPAVASAIESINKKLDSGHSGASYGWTMRNMESIAKKGWEVYMLGWRLSMLKKALENRLLSNDERKNLCNIKFKLERMIVEAEDKAKNKNPLATILQQATTVDTFLRTQAAENSMVNPLLFAIAAQNDPAMRSMIPDIDQQADAMSRFARGEMSYAEMRGLCG